MEPEPNNWYIVTIGNTEPRCAYFVASNVWRIYTVADKFYEICLSWVSVTIISRIAMPIYEQLAPGYYWITGVISPVTVRVGYYNGLPDAYWRCGGRTITNDAVAIIGPPVPLPPDSAVFDEKLLINESGYYWAQAASTKQLVICDFDRSGFNYDGSIEIIHTSAAIRRGISAAYLVPVQIPSLRQLGECSGVVAATHKLDMPQRCLERIS